MLLKKKKAFNVNEVAFFTTKYNCWLESSFWLVFHSCFSFSPKFLGVSLTYYIICFFFIQFNHSVYCLVKFNHFSIIFFWKIQLKRIWQGIWKFRNTAAVNKRQASSLLSANWVIHCSHYTSKWDRNKWDKWNNKAVKQGQKKILPKTWIQKKNKITKLIHL